MPAPVLRHGAAPADLPVPVAGRTIDVFLIVAGVALLLGGYPLFGAPLASFGVVLPLVMRGKRPRTTPSALRLVPAELNRSYLDLLTAVSLGGVDGASEITRCADDLVLEVAAVLGGRPPRGAAQRRFVEARVRAIEAMTAAAEERHAAWLAARAEVEAISAIPLSDPVPAPPTSRSLVRLFVVVLFAAFILWDLGGLIVRAAMSLVDGLALRARAAIRLLMDAGLLIARFARRSLRQWRQVRAALVLAAREARGEAAAARTRLRLHMRSARRNVRRARVG